MATQWRPAFETQPTETETHLDVEGEVPGWLRGTYLLNGPGAFEAGGEPLTHWFDAYAMLRRFGFEDDGLRYANRYVQSRDHEYEQRTGGVRRPFPGTPPDRSLPVQVWQALSGAFPDNPAIGVARMGGTTLAVTESPVGLAVDPETLSVTGRRDLTAGLDADLTLGHLHGTGDGFYNLGVSYGRDPAYTLFRRPDADPARADPTPLTRVRIDRRYVPYVHSFALTERYAVLVLPPFGLDPRALLAGAFSGGTFVDAFDGFDDPTTVVVLDRETGRESARITADPLFVYHHANAYEDGGEVVLDCVAYPDERAVTGLTLDGLRTGGPEVAGDLIRLRLPLSGGRADRTLVHEGPVEFPMIHYRRYNGREYGSVWLAEVEAGPIASRLSRVPVDGGRPAVYDPGEGVYPGEPAFVPAPSPDGETDGVVLSVLLDAGEDRSVLAVLDAAEMTELARAPLPHRLPYAFHGQFFPAGDGGTARTMN
ncbi:MAG: carotenoid oxygenase family protein [Salinirussus sp.]